MDYAGLELTTERSASNISPLCVTLPKNNNLNNNFQRKLVPVPNQPLLLKWNNRIQRSLIRGRGISLGFEKLSKQPWLKINYKLVNITINGFKKYRHNSGKKIRKVNKYRHFVKKGV